MSNMNIAIDTLLSIDGALAAAIVDSNSGMILAAGGSSVDLELAAAGNTEVVRAKTKTMKSLGLKDSIEDILITLGKQYHILRPIEKHEGLFIYVVLDKSKSNLALARRKVLDVEQALEM
jgi:predicted regulator of Ras-like GTPase activity (Roadblock/LC7/MglB family)